MHIVLYRGNINTENQRYTYILAYMHKFIHKSKPPIIPSTTDNGKMIFIYSGYFYSASLSPLGYYSEALPTTAIDTVSEFTREALQATVSEGLAQSLYIVARAGFEPRAANASNFIVILPILQPSLRLELGVYRYTGKGSISADI